MLLKKFVNIIIMMRCKMSLFKRVFNKSSNKDVDSQTKLSKSVRKQKGSKVETKRSSGGGTASIRTEGVSQRGKEESKSYIKSSRRKDYLDFLYSNDLNSEEAKALLKAKMKRRKRNKMARRSRRINRMKTK